jgi:tRNA(Arg) A34 adenosine deaminase TadA
VYEEFMRVAIGEAVEAKQNGNFPFGAVVVRDSKIVATGRCLEITENDVTRHAELIAVSEACRALGTLDLADCLLIATAEPCNMCASAAFQADISSVVIGATRRELPHFFRQRDIGIEQMAKDAGHKVEIFTGVLSEQVIQLFEDINKSES